MDSILTTLDILQSENWIYFKIFDDPSLKRSWKDQLDWYHQVLIKIVKPLIHNSPEVRAVFFGTYGPEKYEPEKEEYENKIVAPNVNVDYLRLRLSVDQESKEDLKNKFVNELDSRKNIVWGYETMLTYHVRCDLGDRYGSHNDDQTLQFIRYWDAACRYILSILTLPGNWTQDVDVWGIPHLVNNSLGAWLRPERSPVLCPACQTHMYMPARYELPSSVTVSSNAFPIVLFVCPKCFESQIRPFNI